MVGEREKSPHIYKGIDPHSVLKNTEKMALIQPWVAGRGSGGYFQEQMKEEKELAKQYRKVMRGEHGPTS